MTQHRLIINTRGETAKVIDDTLTLQIGVRADRVTEFGGMTISEFVMTAREAVALALQLADAAGYVCEMTQLKTKGK